MAKKITAISVYTKDGGWSTPYPIGSTTVKEASATIAGILKAYTSTGSNTDGTMTQAAITQALSSIDALETKTDNMKASFQAGVDGIYNAITAQGTTPASKSQSDVQAAIPTLANNSYNKGYAAAAAATKTLKYPSSIKFWRYNDGASIVYPTISKGSDGVWVLDIPKDHINSAGGGTPTGYEIQWAEASLS